HRRFAAHSGISEETRLFGCRHRRHHARQLAAFLQGRVDEKEVRGRMGMDQKVVFASANLPTWSQVVDACAKQKVPVQLRMIDGELALPDETPPHDWRELRVGTPGGMLTLRRESDGVALVTWGNADEKLKQDWNTLA